MVLQKERIFEKLEILFERLRVVVVTHSGKLMLKLEVITHKYNGTNIFALTRSILWIILAYSH